MHFLKAEHSLLLGNGQGMKQRWSAYICCCAAMTEVWLSVDSGRLPGTSPRTPAAAQVLAEAAQGAAGSPAGSQLPEGRPLSRLRQLQAQGEDAHAVWRMVKSSLIT